MANLYDERLSQAEDVPIPPFESVVFLGVVGSLFTSVGALVLGLFAAFFTGKAHFVLMFPVYCLAGTVCLAVVAECTCFALSIHYKRCDLIRERVLWYAGILLLFIVYSAVRWA